MISIVLVVFFLLCGATLIPLDKLGKNIAFYILCAILILIAAFRAPDSSKDYGSYIDMFENAYDYIVEPCFILITFLIQLIVGNKPIYLFIIFAILGVGIKFIAIKQLSQLWFLSVVVYLSNFFILHELTQIRAGVASGLLLLCIQPILERQLKWFLLFAFLAISFHYSALLILPLWFLNDKPQKKLLICAIPVAYLIYFSKINLILFLPIPGIQEKMELYKNLQEIDSEVWNVINVFNMLFLARIAIFYFILFKYDLIVSYNKYLPILIKIYCISLLSFPIFATMPIVAFRISEFLGIVEIILFPLIYYIVKPPVFGKFAVLLIATSIILIVLFYTKILVY